MPYEIGSHFELDDKFLLKNKNSSDWLPKGNDFAFTFSGRAAIELAIKDISEYRKVNTVYMPNYSCYSMVQPFIENGIHVKYYDVEYCNNMGVIYDINTDTECDVFFAMSYFGLEKIEYDNVIEKFSNRGVFVIEDMTHRLLCEKAHSEKAHYSIASIRKWFHVPTGGFITKHNGSLFNKPKKSSEKLVKQKLVAMKQKYQYLQGEYHNKDSFLGGFAEFDRKLKSVTSDYMIDRYSFEIINSINVEMIRERRKNNAKLLYKGLERLDIIQPLIRISNSDFNKNCPLFVPIMVKGGKRDELRKYLIEYNIYCPVHWPPKKDKENSNIWKEELSLICDHRYTETDMQYILNRIEQWQTSEFR